MKPLKGLLCKFPKLNNFVVNKSSGAKMIIRVKNLSKKFGSKILFEQAEFLIHKEDKIALIGQNGTGKSTLINCIVGEESYDGLIEMDKEIKISLMEQERKFEKEENNFSNYLAGKRNALQEKIKACEMRLAEPEIYENMEKFEKIMSEYEILTSRVVEKIEEENIRKILIGLDFEMECYNRKIINLSGGQRTKLRLAECLAKRAELLILDEPTNHLDFTSITWLENWLLKTKQTVIAISHDRYFLKKFVNRVFEIEGKKLQMYIGNYERYREERRKHLKELGKAYYSNEKERKRLLDSAKEKREWARVHLSKKLRMLAESLERRAALIPVVTNPKDICDTFNLTFGEGERPGNMIFSVVNAGKSFGEEEILKDLNFTIHRKEKIVILGKNGSGKSTLLKMLDKLIEADNGRINTGTNVKIGYFDQELKDIDQELKVLDFFRKTFPFSQEHYLISTAIKFGFPRDKLRDRINTLSGGEKARLNLVRLMLKKSNVLILDEPTNNLDLELIEQLEKALLEYDETIIFVSHDRYFMDKIATRVLEIKDKKVQSYDGNYSDRLN